MSVDITSLPQERLMEMVFAAMAAKAVHAATELGLPDLLADESRTCADLAERTHTHPPSLRRLLVALAGLGIVDHVDADRFQLTDLGEPLRSETADSIRGLVTMLCGSEVWTSWDELVGSVRTGETGWNRAHGTTWIEFYEQHPEQSATFNTAMAEHTRDAAPGILAAAELGRFHTVMDVGGGDGTLIAHALRAHPTLNGIVFDLPSGLASAADIGSRGQLVGGDFFTAVPEGADAYLLKQVLHDWDDDRAVTILRNVRRALPDDGRVLIVERTLPDPVTAGDPRTPLLDLLMLVVTGGRERTEAEFVRLMDAADLEPTRLGGPFPPFDYRVLEAAPRITASEGWRHDPCSLPPLR